MAERLLIDTGPIVAVLDTQDQHHALCQEAANKLPEVAFTCWPVIAEACFLLRKRQDRVENLLEMVHGGYYVPLEIKPEEVLEIGGWMSKYRDQQIDFADACLAYIANREGIDTIFTVDTRHFSLFRTGAGESLTLIPDLRE